MALLGYLSFTTNMGTSREYNATPLVGYPYAYLSEHTEEVSDISPKDTVKGTLSYFDNLANEVLASPCYTMYYYYKHNRIDDFKFICNNVFYRESAQSQLIAYLLDKDGYSKEVTAFIMENTLDGKKLLQRINKYRSTVLNSKKVLEMYSEEEIKNMKTKLSLTAIATRGIDPKTKSYEVYSELWDRLEKDPKNNICPEGAKYDLLIVYGSTKESEQPIQVRPIRDLTSDIAQLSKEGFKVTTLGSLQDRELFYMLSAPVVRSSETRVAPVFKVPDSDDKREALVAGNIKLQRVTPGEIVEMYPGFPAVEVTRSLSSFFGARYDIYFKSAVWDWNYVSGHFDTYRKVVLGCISDDQASEVEFIMASDNTAVPSSEEYQTSDTLMGIASLLGD